MPNTPTAEMNRFTRDLYRRALDLRFKAEDGETVRDDVRKLSAEAAAVKSTALANLTPVATRVKNLQSHSFNSTGANAHSYLQSLGPHGFKAALPGIIAKANAGDEEALAFAGAAIGILDNMPGAQRPLTSKKLARIIDLSEFDADHPNASESVNLISATEKLCGIIADGRNPTTREKIALGQLLNDVRPAEALVRSAVTAGQGVGQVIGGLRQTVFPRTAKYVLGTARTIYAHAQATVLDNVASTDLDDLHGLRWTSVLDGKTSAICRARSGEVYQPFEGPRPPAHFNCRSVMVPVFAGGGDVLESTYEQWLRRQPRGFVEEVMGKRKADIFLSGDISLDRFVDTNGQELRVDELSDA